MKSRFFQPAESKILLTGIMMTGFLFLLIGYIAVTDFEKAEALFLAFIAHTFGGRSAGIGLCIMSGMNLFWTVVYNFYLEILIVCFTYSIFVLSLNNYIKIQWVELWTRRLVEKAGKHTKKIRTYGWIGIFIFVMMPLPVTGPVVGSVIGYLLQMSLWRNFTAAALGTFCAIVGWTFGFDFLERHLHVIQYVLVGILLIVALSYMKTISNWLLNKGSGPETDKHNSKISGDIQNMD